MAKTNSSFKRAFVSSVGPPAAARPPNFEVHKISRIGVATVVVLAAVAAGVAMLWNPGARSLADQTDPDLVAQGKEVYKRFCAACHGLELEGQPNWQSRKPSGALPAPPHDESGHT